MIFIDIFDIICISQVIGLENFLQYQHYTRSGTDWLRLPEATTEPTANLSKIDCLFACENNNGCFSINYNENSLKCELNTIFMPRNLTDCTAETGWRVYGKYTDLKTGAVAWQSSTHLDLESNRALDGNTTTIIDESYRSCSHTDEGSSYLAMEFPEASFVGRIVIYFRSECCYERSANLHLLVSQTRDDLIDDVGILCAFYAGSPVDSTAPVTILWSCLQKIPEN